MSHVAAPWDHEPSTSPRRWWSSNEKARPSMAHPDIMAEQAALITALLAAFALSALYLRRCGHLRLLSGACWLPALLIVAFSLPDALATLSGTWNAPSREADPFVGIFLTWAGWRGLCLALMIWILGWTLVLDGLETVRLRLPPRLAPLPRARLRRALRRRPCPTRRSRPPSPLLTTRVRHQLRGLRPLDICTASLFPLALSGHSRPLSPAAVCRRRSPAP